MRLFLALLVLACLAAAEPPLQAPTATPPVQRVEVAEDVNVRSGPGTQYDLVGVLIPGQTSEILGRSPDGQWLQIVYVGGPSNTGWVLAQFVRVVGDISTFPTVQPPPTATRPPTSTPALPAAPGTPTVDPVEAGRLPTFTPPAPQVQPTLLPAQGAGPSAPFPPAALILGLLVLGTLGGLLSLLRGRR